MAQKTDFDAEWMKLLWPGLLAAEAGAAVARRMLGAFSPPAAAPAPPPEPVWATPNNIVLELAAARLRRFSVAAVQSGRRPVVVCAPFALHDARIADLCEGHSLMATLGAGAAPLYLVDWLSAKPAQSQRGIDDFLSDLNIFVDEIGGAADFVGLCQGGWLSLIYAARFPEKAGKLVLAAAPIDIEAGESRLSALARSTPIESFRELVRLGEGLARGGQAMRFWRFEMQNLERIHQWLQSESPPDSPQFHAKVEAFRAWSAHVLDLPGAYYLEVVEKFYKRNELARGQFVALGKTIDLREVRHPIYLIAARDDEVTAPEQTFSCARLVGTPRPAIRRKTAPCGHLSLFVGAQSLQELWPDVVDWLAAP
ncbi:alpha/beta fold hydrolase [uncultured Rhodoblastus sp.]|uniref:alpha/beta fold hydrolase n=1 Tax=uncultured Rhodoblastus sp. TaxID=543037 RepID=UPI0025FE30F9|nr:alpha/beta fold hydrolase [uncultured Rhodoblastus sp.]